jgi:hypothetical protein
MAYQMFDDKKEDRVAEDSKLKDGSEPSSEQPIDVEAGQLSTPLQTKAMIIDHRSRNESIWDGQIPVVSIVAYKYFSIEGLYCALLSRCIWAICGTGFWLDVTWFAIFSYAAPSMQRELGYSDEEYGNLFSSFSAGSIMAGAAVWGILVDIMGMPGRI